MSIPTAPAKKGRLLVWLARLALVFIVAVGIFCAVVAMQPAEYRVERSSAIAAPAPVVFNQVNDFHNWPDWSPWAKLDPNMKTTFEGPTSGTGAIYKWTGNDDVGEGKMTILESKPGEYVKIDLEFIRPFASSAINEFSFKTEGDKTQVKWTMNGHNNFMAKAFCLFMNMDKMIGGDFEKGLSQLKTVAEAKK